MKAKTPKPPQKKPVDLFDQVEPPRSQLAVTLFNEPEEEILVLGLVMADAELIEQKLRGSVRKSPTDYRGDLRVIVGAAVRIKQRCQRLLHEDEVR